MFGRRTARVPRASARGAAAARRPLGRGPGTVAWLVPVLLLTLCGAGRQAMPIETRALPAVADLAHADSPREILDGVSSTLLHELGLPLPARFHAFVYDSRAAFRDGLVNDADVSEAIADEMAGFAVGIARRERVLFNARDVRGHVEWIRLIAHEVTHIAQFELAGGDGRGDQWLAEGMAEYAAFRVLEHAGVDSLERRRDVARQGARHQRAFVQARLDLDSLGSQRGFTLRHQREGSVETYHLAFLMTDYLVTRNGFPRLITYFRELRRLNRTEAFERAFGQRLPAFEREVLEHLQRVLG
jgi:hypothetical protein